jgi:hypothetical protein
MGTGYTIDTPLKVAKYGISSVISLVDDMLIEQMRRFYCEKEGEPYEEIEESDEDCRARRITAYLNLVNLLVKRQVAELRSSPFEEGSEINKYFRLLPDSPSKQLYLDMLKTADSAEKAEMQARLRLLVVPGSIDVNIMTKVDRDTYRNGDKLPPEYNDAMSAFRGFANSDLNSSIVLSAGMNPRLYGYIANFPDFIPDENGLIRKKLTLKISDYRSAFVQGKYLANRRLWVSEFRIESGLNCGGHAFASNGNLMGPILDELNHKKSELIENLHKNYNKALTSMSLPELKEPFNVRITVQGGIGTAGENEFLLKYYNVDSTGWGTPFLLVPEVANIDDEHIRKLIEATDKEVFLSNSSPFGIPFWNLRNSASEESRRSRIRDGHPGSPCPKGYLKINSEFCTPPLCSASRKYVRLKMEKLSKNSLSEEQMHVLKDDTLAKSCICHDLAGVATLKNNIDPDAKPAICCGPNIVNFSKIATLEEMVGHIYGRLSLPVRKDRPHMFIKELMLYVDYLHDEIEKYRLKLSTRKPKYFMEFRENLLSGIENYRNLAEQFIEEQKTRFLNDLKTIQDKIENMPLHIVGC